MRIQGFAPPLSSHSNDKNAPRSYVFRKEQLERRFCQLADVGAYPSDAELYHVRHCNVVERWKIEL